MAPENIHLEQALIKHRETLKDHFNPQENIDEQSKIRLVEHGGFLALPHSISEFVIKSIKRRTDLIIFFCLIRYTLGFNRHYCKASNTFIANWTGLHAPHVRRSLKNLKSLGLVEVISPGTSGGTPTVYELPIIKNYLEWRAMDLEKPGRYPQDNQSCYSKSTKLVSKKEKQNKKVNTTLSQKNILPVSLEEYISSIRSPQKREQEDYFLSKLLSEFEAYEIVDSLTFIQQNGALETKKSVHSPMKYLSYTCEQILQVVNKNKSKQRRAIEVQQEINENLVEEKLKAKHDSDVLNKAIQLFESELSNDEQLFYLDQYNQNNFAHLQFSMPKAVVRTSGIKAWFKERYP
jgi:hypothetical protein